MSPAGASGASRATVVLVVLAMLVTHPLPSRAEMPAAAAPVAASVVAAPVVAGPVVAGPVATIAVRSGSHGDYGRLVIDTSGSTVYTLDQDGDHLVVHLSGDGLLAPPPLLPRNVVALKTDGSVLDLMLRHGAKVHAWRMNGRVVLDIADDKVITPGVAASPPTASAGTPSMGALSTSVPNPKVPSPKVPDIGKPAPKAKPRPPLSMASSPELGGRSKPVAKPTLAGPEPVLAQPLLSPPDAVPVTAPRDGVRETQQLPPGRDVLPQTDGPLALRARRARLPKEMDGTAFLVPFESTTGAAAFNSGDSTYIVFDERRAVDMAALKDDPVFAAASVRLLPNGTILRVPHPDRVAIALTQMQQGWRVAAFSATPKREPIIASESGGRLNLAAEQPSDVVAMADPATGATLLVGTQHRPGQAVATSRRGTEFILRPTLQGVVVEPLSDAITLKPTSTGFTLSGPPSGLALSPATSDTDMMMDAARLTRRLNFSSMPKEALLRQAVSQLDAAAATPPLARGAKHHAAAETFLAMGLSVEAESLLHMAADQDPKEAASPDTRALTAIAALLGGRPEESDGIMDPKLDGTDEIALWRGIRQAMQDEGSPRAAAVFSATAPLALQYPAPIRDGILPLMAETMIEGGEIAPAARLLAQRPADPKLGYARALLAEAEGDSGKALTLFDALAAGHDQYDRARAAVRAVALRLSTGALDKVQAANALDKLLYAWRGDARELALRERVAELRGETGSWRVALALLRQAETDFPDQAASIHDRLKDTFAAMIRDKGAQQVPPIEFVAMVEENSDLVPASGDDEVVEKSLVDRLLALDLPGRAKPVLEKLMAQTKSPVTKARFGASLATMAERDGDDAATLAMLDASRGADLPPDLAEERMILRAGSMARRGDPTGAAALLASSRSSRAMQARAQILEAAADWPAAEQAWSDCVVAGLPDTGMLDDGQTRMVLRLATVTARADDTARLAVLRDGYGARIGPGALGDMFRLLTAEPISTTADIVRSQREMSLAASLPAGLKAIGSRASAR